MRVILGFMILALLASSCMRNYSKELEELVENYRKEGKHVIAISQNKHFVIYKDGDAFWMNNLDEPAKKILSADKEMVSKHYYLAWNENGKPSIASRLDKEKLERGFFQENAAFKDEVGYVYPYTESDMKLLNEDALFFQYRKFYESPRDFESKLLSTTSYVYYFSNPDTLFQSRIPPVIHETKSRSEIVESYARDLADAIFPMLEQMDIFPYRCDADQGEGGYFRWSFDVDTQGKVINVNDNLEYYNDMYDKQMSFSLSDFETKEKSKSVLMTINDTINVERIQELIEKSMTIEELDRNYNKVDTDKSEYIGKDFIIKCELQSVEKIENYQDLDGYKYKILSFASRTKWLASEDDIEGCDIIGYTNDDNFLQIDYPKHVIMKVVLNYGEPHKFEFADCQLIAW